MRAMTEPTDKRPRQRKLAAILCADVAGFSRLMGEDESATYEGLARLRAAVDPLIERHRGRIVSTAGDGLLADFGSVVDALACAVDIQAAAAELNAPLALDRRLQLRIGVNLGDVIVAEDGDLYGDGVNIAARLQTIAAPGEICLSQTVYDHVRNKLDLDFRPLGKHRVKNISAPVTVYSVGSARLGPQSVRRHRVTIGIIAALVLLNTALGFWLWDRSIDPDSPASAEATQVAALATPSRLAERTSVAVLPFKNLSPGGDQDPE